MPARTPQAGSAARQAPAATTAQAPRRLGLGLRMGCDPSFFAVSARERSDAFARLAEHAAAGELTVEYRETGLEALPAIWDDFAARRAETGSSSSRMRQPPP